LQSCKIEAKEDQQNKQWQHRLAMCERDTKDIFTIAATSKNCLWVIDKATNFKIVIVFEQKK
jgi:hypothetical protein